MYGENRMEKKPTQPATARNGMDQCLQQMNDEVSQIKASFNRIRALMAQEYEQKHRPAARIYSGMRALKA
jgi:HAMP domain-containing protein